MVSYMYFALILIFAGSNVLAGSDTDDFIKSLVELLKRENFEEGCCEAMDPLLEKTKDCKSEKEEWTCEDSKCVLGDMWLDNGQIDKAKAGEMLDEVDKNYPDAKGATDRIRRRCFDVDEAKFDFSGSNEKYEKWQHKIEEICPAIKTHVCFYLNSITECSSWKNTDKCKEMSEHAKKCKDVFDSMDDAN